MACQKVCYQGRYELYLYIFLQYSHDSRVCHSYISSDGAVTHDMESSVSYELSSKCTGSHWTLEITYSLGSHFTLGEVIQHLYTKTIVTCHPCSKF